MSALDSKRDLVNALPKDVALYEVATYLTADDLGRCCRVSKAWKAIAEDEYLWKQLFPNFPKEIFPEGLTIKQIRGRYSYIAKSMNEVKEHITKLARNLLLNQKTEFSCIFSENRQNSFKVVLRLDSDALPRENDLRKTCLVLEKLEGSASRFILSFGGSSCDYLGFFLQRHIFYEANMPIGSLGAVSDSVNALQSRAEEACSFNNSIGRAVVSVVSNVFSRR